jgi:hypothetical protein
VGSTFVPKTTKGSGRAELGGVGKAAGLGEKVVVEEVKVGEEGFVVGDAGVWGREEMEGRGVERREGRYGLRPEELDSEGRYVGELHGDGRQVVPGFELQGSETLR